MMDSEIIKKDIESFQVSLKHLSAGIGNASLLWKDEKYAELSSNVSSLANQSKNVVVTGERCCSSIEKFSKIANEKY